MRVRLELIAEKRTPPTFVYTLIVSSPWVQLEFNSAGPHASERAAPQKVHLCDVSHFSKAVYENATEWNFSFRLPWEFSPTIVCAHLASHNFMAQPTPLDSLLFLPRCQALMRPLAPFIFPCCAYTLYANTNNSHREQSKSKRERVQSCWQLRNDESTTASTQHANMSTSASDSSERGKGCWLPRFAERKICKSEISSLETGDKQLLNSRWTGKL